MEKRKKNAESEIHGRSYGTRSGKRNNADKITEMRLDFSHRFSLKHGIIDRPKRFNEDNISYTRVYVCN